MISLRINCNACDDVLGNCVLSTLLQQFMEGVSLFQYDTLEHKATSIKTLFTGDNLELLQ